MAKRRTNKPYDGPDRRDDPQVLVVNDDGDAAELIRRLLVKDGYRVDVSGSTEDTIAKMIEYLPRAVLLDLTTGGIGTNLKLLEGIRNHSDRRISTARVILVARQAANRVFSFQSGADGFLVRPFHVSQLLETVEKVISMPFDDLPQHRRAEVDGGRLLPRV